MLETQAHLEAVLGELSVLVESASRFDEVLSSTLQQVNLEPNDGLGAPNVGGGDLINLLNIPQIQTNQTRELQNLQQMTSMLHSSIEPLSNLRDRTAGSEPSIIGYT